MAAADPQIRTLAVNGLSEDGKSYVELSRGGEGESISSRVLPGLCICIAVSEVFPRPK